MRFLPFKSTAQLLTLLLVLFSGFVALPQASYKNQTEMSKLHFLKGIWKGEGWTLDGSFRREFYETETVNVKLNGACVIIEAFGVDKQDSTNTIVNALGKLTYDEASKNYVMRIIDADGSIINPYLILTNDHTIEWGLKEKIKFIITVKNDTWIETGYRKTENEEWKKTFEINLRKQ